MIRAIVLLVMIFILSLSAPVLAAEPGDGMIKGQLINGTAGGSSVADQDITLKTYLNDAEVGVNTSKTNAEGQFVFDGLSTESGYSYEVSLTYQQAEYFSGRLSFDEGETVKSAEVTVYDSTTNGEVIKVATAHTIVYVGQGSLQVKEYFRFVNETDRSYIGLKQVNTEGDRETLRLFLPAEASEVELIYGLMQCCVVGSEEGFVDTMAVLPGSKEVVYAYTVNYNSGAYTFSRRINYPIASYAFLVEGENTEVISDRLATEQPLEIEGSWFNHLTGSNLAPEDTLQIRLLGLPVPENQNAILWVILLLAVLGGGFGFVYLMRQKNLQAVSPEDSPDQIRQRLLIQLAQLDDDFEEGKIPEDAYRRQRTETKAQLLAIMQSSNTGRDNG